MSYAKPVSQSAWRDGFDTEQLAQNCPFSDRHPVPGESDAQAVCCMDGHMAYPVAEMSGEFGR